MRKFFIAFLLLCVLFGAAGNASARQQNLASAALYPADYSAFPEVSVLMDVFDSRGIFVSGLKPNAVSVYEDGAALPVNALTETAVPLQLAIAVNQGQPLDARDASNLSRFERAAQILTAWAAKLPADLPDDFSLVSQAGAVINHTSSVDFAVGLGGFKPDFRASTPNLLSLSIALDTVSAQTPRLGMKRAILFITPHMDDFNLAATLEPLKQRAQSQNIRVFVWFIDAATAFQSPSALAFNDLAAQTGGAIFYFSGVERFPDPEVYFAALRRVYAVQYTSRIKAGGEHTLAAKVSFSNGALESLAQTFTLDVQPPRPFALTNDLNIVRRPSKEDPFNIEALQPAAQEVRIIVEFPDGHPRPLTRSTLYIDNVIMDENTSEPFDVFTWNISAYDKSGEHQMMVEAVDSLGLQSVSLSVPVAVTVVKPLSGGLGLLAKYRMQFTFGAIFLAGLILFLALMSGKLPSLRAMQTARRVQADPLTQPLAAAPATKNIKTKAIARANVKKEARALLIRLNPDGQPAPVAPIVLLDQEILFGADPVQATQILDDPSISPLHARIRPTEEGEFILADNASLAGTWINYDLVSREGARLKHGDVIHFGQMTYRFTLQNPPEASGPTVTFLSIEE